MAQQPLLQVAPAMEGIGQLAGVGLETAVGLH